MNNMYEGQYIINSFYAVDADTEEQIMPDNRGYITVSAEQKILFKALHKDGYADVNTLVIFAGDDPVKLQINDNELYPFYVGAETQRGIGQMRIYSIKALADCKFYYEGIVCD